MNDPRESLIDDIKVLINKCEEFSPLNPYLQSLLSFTRGPDANNYQLKFFTTSRVRAIAFPHYKGDINPDPLNSSEIAIRDKLLSDAGDHFSQHYYAAVKAILGIFQYDLIREQGFYE